MSLSVEPNTPLFSATEAEGASGKSPLIVLDELIGRGNPVTYKGQNFKDGQVVANFIQDHRPLRTAMLGTVVSPYIDPCTCCIPAHGQRDFKSDIADATRVIAYVREAKARGEALDILFTSLNLYKQVKDSIEKISPETKLIVACDRRSGVNASDLRKQNIPAIDEGDYMRVYLKFV